MTKVLTLTFWLLSSLCFGQQFILGKWRTIDDNTNEEKSIVEIFEKGGKVFGKIIRIFPKQGEDPDPVCNKCDEDDNRYKKKIVGMEIIRNMQWSGNALTNGDILDPEVGKIYRCKLWIEGNELMVRGYWGPFYRTQTWKRVN